MVKRIIGGVLLVVACLMLPSGLSRSTAAEQTGGGSQASTGQNRDFVNSIGMKLALIPAGEFIMGSPATEKGRSELEKQHRVRITRAFYLGVTTVTQSEYERVMGNNPSWFSATGRGKNKMAGQDTSRFPVENICWEDAQNFCRKLSQKEGKTYRLPTEAEWEYACRAGTTTPFNFGNKLNGQEANCNGESPYGTSTRGPNLERMCEVGTYQPNAFGLYDMHGNVWQCCQDWYDLGYYADSPGQDPKGPESGSSRVIRGGAWNAFTTSCRSASRLYNASSVRIEFLGFRVVREQ